MSDSIFALDFGTSYTVCTFFRNKYVEFVSYGNGKHAISSIVNFEGNSLHFGVEVSSKDYLRRLKMLIGENLNSLRKQGIDCENFGMDLKEKDGELGIESKGTFYKVQDLITGFVKNLKMQVEKQSGKQMTQVIITVPARFSNKQRRIYIKAVESSGLKIFRLLNEPTAAIFDIIEKDIYAKDSMYIVYDLGGGTFDCSLVRVSGSKSATVLYSDGTNKIGSELFDEKIFQYACNKAINDGHTFLDPKQHRAKYNEILKQVTFIKEAISKGPFDIELTDIINGKYEYYVNITEPIVNSIVEPYIKDSLKIVDNMLNICEIQDSSVDFILLTGGGSLLPLIRKLVQEHYRNTKVLDSFNPKEIVARGALISFEDSSLSFRDVTFYNYSLELYNGKCYTMIPKGTEIPMKCPIIRKFTTEHPGQKKAETAIYQGLSEDSSENQCVAKIEFDLRKTSSSYFNIELFVDERDMIEIRVFEDGSANKLYSKEVPRL